MSEQFHFQSGQWSLDREHYDAGIRHFETLLNSAEGHNRMVGLFVLAEAHRLNCNFNTALICYEEVLRTNSDRVDPRVAGNLKSGALKNIEQCRALRNISATLNGIFRPKRLLIEPTNVCNYSCYKCLYPRMTRKKSRLDPEKYEGFLSRWAGRCGAFEEIIFTGGGEALLHRGLAEIVRISKRQMPASKLTVGSNLALLTEKRAVELVEAGLNNWEVSFDTVNRYEHLYLTENDTFDKVLENIKMLWKLLGEGSRGTLEVAAHRPFDGDYDRKIAEIEEIVRGHYTLFRHAPYTTLMGRNHFPGLELWDGKLSYDDPSPNVCLEPWEHLIVTADGSVRRCCSDMFDCPDEETFGNIFAQDLDEILRNGRRRELQRRLQERDLKGTYLCGNRCFALFLHTSPVHVGCKQYD